MSDPQPRPHDPCHVYSSGKNSNVFPIKSLTSSVRSPYLSVFIKQQIESSEIKKKTLEIETNITVDRWIRVCSERSIDEKKKQRNNVTHR